MKYLFGILLACFVCNAAEARGHHHYQHHARVHRYAASYHTRGHSVRIAHRHLRVPTHRRFASYDSGTIVGHPSGCPSRLFCGCGAAVEVFHSAAHVMTIAGRRMNLWLAAEWLRFQHVPQSMAQPGMVAASHGHVFVLRENLGDGRWRIYDANSGGGLTRVHVIDARTLARYTVVNPHGGPV